LTVESWVCMALSELVSQRMSEWGMLKS